MLHQQDSIANPQVGQVAATDTTMHKPARPQTPYQVLRMLPKDATPAQQDSAIQAWFQPGEIHYSQQPDTLHLPGHGIGRNVKDVSLPQYYRETFFARDTLLHPELSGGRFGVAGDPMPYTVRGDNVITGILIICFVMALVIFGHNRQTVIHQLKDFTRLPRLVANTASPGGMFQLFLCLQTCLLLSIISFFYIDHFVPGTFVLDTPYELIAIFFGVFVAYLLVKCMAYSIVNNVFFESKKNRHWIWTLIFITALEGVALFPAVILQVYLNLSMQSVAYYFIFVLALTKILTFSKCWLIFFRQISVYLQIILYLCALEIIPLLSLWGVLVLITDQLKVNF